MRGLGLLPVTTTFTTEKTRTRVNGTLLHVEGNLKALENLKFEGYEIHMGKTELLEGCPMNQIHDTVKKKDRQIPDQGQVPIHQHKTGVGEVRCGDRQCKEDAAILCGIARFHGMPVTVLGHRKGTTLEENLRCNFGMPGP